MPEDAHRRRLALLLAELGGVTGLPELALDERGKACLLLDERIEIWLEHEPSDAYFTLTHELGPRPESGVFDRWALENSFAAKGMGDVFATLDPVGQSFALTRRVALDELEIAGLQQALEHFLEAVPLWRAAYAEAAAQPAPARATAAAPDRHAGEDRLPVGFGQFV